MMFFELKDRNPVEYAKDIIKRDPIILDTETTGLKSDDEIVEIAAVDIDGDVQINTLIKPVDVIPARAILIHGINNRIVNNAPTFDIVWKNKLKSLLSNRPICLYNYDFDIRLIRQSLSKYGIELGKIGEVICVMRLYAKYKGTWDDHYGHFKWYKLRDAARQSRLSLPKAIHRALADAELTRKLLMHIASQE